MIKRPLFFFWAFLSLSTVANAEEARPLGQVFFVDTCMQEMASIVKKEWFQSTRRTRVGRGHRRKTVDPRVQLKVNFRNLNPAQELYYKVELIEHDGDQLSERKTRLAVEDTVDLRTDSLDVFLPFSKLPLKYRSMQGRLTARLTWIQGEQGGSHSRSVMWRDESEDFFRAYDKAACFWQGPAQLRSSYKYNNQEGIKSLTERVFVYRDFGDSDGWSFHLSTNESEGFYDLNGPNLSEEEVRVLMEERPLQGITPAGFGGWFSSRNSVSESRRGAKSFYQTYNLLEGQGGFYVSRRVYSRHKAARFCFVENSCGGVWQKCAEGSLDVGSQVKGFTIVPEDLVHNSDAVYEFIENWKILPDSCEENPKNTTTFEYVSESLEGRIPDTFDRLDMYFREKRY